ncbi:zinc finger protein 771-like [Protobothrops mucrosquamatus]|uniref:zinc finger protein 771-like n=1 Tax=Protobothrops mucrosquamatus TaxID=103944 RepID=UPI0010FB6F3D|nr:zinc finger protein 771-like [Protobothrops mucrosquamatus]
MQESYETVISMAEELAISWPRIAAFTEIRGRQGLAHGLEMEPEQGQLAPLQGEAAAATAGSSGEGIFPDIRRQLGVILQTIGKAQVEKMLRELVKEQEQQGRVRRRKRVSRSPRHGGDETVGQNNLEISRELHTGIAEGPAVLSRKPFGNEAQVSFKHPGLAGPKQPKMIHGDMRGWPLNTQALPGNPASTQSRKPHACDECGKRFRILANLERHQQRHTAEKPHQCRDCGRRFRWGCHLERHRRSRQPDRPYSCGECGRRFTQRSALSKHRRLHSGERPYGCGECGKRFLQRSDLTIHIRSHSGEQPYACTECGRRFSVSSNLSKHRRMHRGERPHACPVCSKRFLQRSELLIHQRAHTGERPYPCTACGKRFARRAHLKRHQRTHGGLPDTTTASRHQNAHLLTTPSPDAMSFVNINNMNLG